MASPGERGDWTVAVCQPFAVELLNVAWVRCAAPFGASPRAFPYAGSLIEPHAGHGARLG